MLTVFLTGCGGEAGRTDITLPRAQPEAQEETQPEAKEEASSIQAGEPTAEVKPTAAQETTTTGHHSRLWGKAGELWTPQSRLPYFAHAGYEGGMVPLPNPTVVTQVTDFGAKGDGTTDDTQAILDAIAATPEGAIFFPAGRYVITRPIEVTRSNIVLRGAGPEETVLVFPKSLEEVHAEGGLGDHRASKKNFAFDNAFVKITGQQTGGQITMVKEPAARGDRQLVLQNARELKPGNWIAIRMGKNAELGRYLHANHLDAGPDAFNQGLFVNWVAQITAVEGDTVTIDRPLRFDIRPQWQPRVHLYQPTLENSGIEGFTFEFNGRPKRPTNQEEGFNGIEYREAANCWIRDVRFIDCDNGIKFMYTRFSTIKDVSFVSDKRQGIVDDGLGVPGVTGHHAIWMWGHSQDNLIEDFSIGTLFHHDITVEWFANGNVFRRGKGHTLNFDHHRMAPHENLFTDIHAGDATRLWQCSGRKDRGPNSGARSTFWNIRYHTGQLSYRGVQDRSFPDDFPEVNVIGVSGTSPASSPHAKNYDAWIGGIGNTIASILAFASVPAVTALARRYGKERVLRWIVLANILVALSMLFIYNPDYPYLMLIKFALAAPLITGLWLVLPSMQADIVDLDKLDNGKRREGSFASVFSWILKFSSSFTFGMSGVVLDLIGFDVTLGGEQKEEVYSMLLSAAHGSGADRVCAGGSL